MVQLKLDVSALNALFPEGFTETLDVRYEKDVLAIIQKYVQDVPEYEERLCA